MADIMQALRDKGWKGKTLALRMGVCGDGKIRRVTRYDSINPDSIHRQLLAMQALNIAGVVQIWNGPNLAHGHASMMNCWHECEHLGMPFLMQLNQWVAKNTPDPTAATVAALKHPDFQRVFNSSVYVPEKYVMEFDLKGAAGVDMIEVQRRCPRMKFLSNNSGYSWVKADVAELAKVNARPTIKVPSVCLYFNDGGYPMPKGVSTPADQFAGRDWNKSVWGAHGNTPEGEPDESVRVREHQGGHWFMDQIAVTPVDKAYVMLATWDDYEEGTGIEFFAAALAGMRI